MRRQERHGMAEHPVYDVWVAMRQRCLNRNHPRFHQYGGRGIRVCDEWNSFLQFWKDMGSNYERGLTLDRKDTNGNYEPINCQWATAQTQARTRRKWAGTTSKYRGVSWHKVGRKWQSQICIDRKRIHLGLFNTEEEAARAYEAAAKASLRTAVSDSP